MAKQVFTGCMALNYETRRDNHAIGEFTATMKFVNPVTVHTFAKIMQTLEGEAKRLDLPAPVNFQVLNIAFNEGGLKPQIPSPIAGGGFQRFASNGEVACALRCEPDAITLTIREYDRWASVLPMIVETFTALATVYITEVPAIRSFGVQYLNEFRGKSPEVRDTAELFVSGSKWVAPFFVGRLEPWHCHVGQFTPPEGAHRYLINVNCDITPNAHLGSETLTNYVRVLIFAALSFDIGEHGPLFVSEDNIRSAIESNFNLAHAMEKRVLSEVISQQYLAVMGEGASEY